MGTKYKGLIHYREHRPRVFENRVPGKIFGPKRDEVTGGGKDYITMRFMLCTPHKINFGRSN